MTLAWKVYVAGGDPGRREERDAAAEWLRDAGARVWAPDPDLLDAEHPDQLREVRNLRAVLEADLVALLPGWEESADAPAAVVLAKAVGVPVMPMEIISLII